MKIYCGALAIFAITLCISSLGMNKKDKRQMRRSAERILNDKRLSNSAHDEKTLIESLSEQEASQGQTLYPDDLSNIIDALTRKTTLSLVRQNKETLHKAHQLFFLIPGYKTLLQRIVTSTNTSHVQGALYELEVALAIDAQDDDETVIEFGKKIIDDYHQRESTEIDIVTIKSHEEDETETWIECKNMAERTKHLKDLKTQLKRQKDLAAEHQSRYKVLFRSTISPQLTDWLNRQQIAFVAPN